MEQLKSLIPTDLQRSIASSTPENLTLTCNSLLDFLRPLSQFRRLIGDLINPETALCGKSTAAALESKRRGNECFSEGQYAEAISFYYQALRHAPMRDGEGEVNLVATLFINRASAMHKMGLYQECLRDCNRAVVLSPLYAKAWYRRGKANASLKNYRVALCDLEVSSNMEVSSSGKKSIMEEIHTLTSHLYSANETANSSVSGENMKFVAAAEADNIILECVSTPSKGRGMASPKDIPPSSLIHCEEPLAAIMTKSCRETHCHFCFDRLRTDILFCPSCTVPIYCSQNCQELAGGELVLRNKNGDKIWKHLSADLEKYVSDTIAASSKHAATYLVAKHIPEHRHECGGTNWSSALPPNVVLAGRVKAKSIEKKKATGEFFKSMETLEFAHNYIHENSEGKLQLHIYAIVLSYCLEHYYTSDFPATGASASQLVILISQIKINSMAVVHMESLDGYAAVKLQSATDDDFSCTMEQVRVGQAIYSTGSLFNHSCEPNIHAYFLSRRLFLRTTEFVPAWYPLELSYGPQVGQLDLLERQELLKEHYSFKCQCTSCSELNLSDLVINAFRCVQPDCVGAVLETARYKKIEDASVIVSGASHSCKLRLPVLKDKKDFSKVASLLLEKTSMVCQFSPGYCLSCSSNLDVKSSKVASKSAMMDIERFGSSILNAAPDILISECLDSLVQLRSLRHPYSKVVAQAEDNMAKVFVRTRKFERAIQHCTASIEIIEMLYHSNHIAIGHELMKLASIQLALGDSTTALYSIKRLEAIFELYYGSHVADIFPFIDNLRKQANNFTC